MKDPKDLTPDEAVKRLVELADGYAVGARISTAIVNAFQTEREAFKVSTIGDGSEHDIRLIRSVQEEEANARRMLADEAAIRLLLGCVEAGFRP